MLVPGDVSPTIVASIAKVVIRGTAVGTLEAGDFFGVTAQELGKLTINGARQPLTAGPSDVPLDSVNNDFRAVDFA